VLPVFDPDPTKETEHGWKENSDAALLGQSGLRSGLTAAGGTYAEIGPDQAVVDGNLVTAPAWPAHAAWLAAFLKLLGTTIHHG
jgi:putative intracellular protease/amidase